MAKPLYLLDTNILVHACRRDSAWETIKAQFDPMMSEPLPVYSFVTDGELRSLALQWNWGEDADFDFLNGVFLDVARVVSEETGN